MSIYDNALSKIYSEKEDFIIIGLTGRTGSGCSTVASILASKKDDIKHDLFIGDNPSNNEDRKERILTKYFNKTWESFIRIQGSSIITLHLSNDYTTERNKFKEFILSTLFNKKDIDSLDDNENTYLEHIVKKFSGILNEIKREHSDSKISFEKTKEFYNEILIKKNNEVKEVFREKIHYVKIYQALSNNYRVSGKFFSSEYDENCFHGFFIAEKVHDVIREIKEKIKNKKGNKNLFIVIDAIRNPFEATYFHDRYSSFYLMAVSSEDDERKSRLRKLGFDDNDINEVDKKEYARLSLDEKEAYIFQNIQACLEISDIYIKNENEDDITSRYKKLSKQIIKFTSLMKRPGIITPSNIERCMQVAYTAKLNSGCISRQVGAAVASPTYSIKSIGWNDVPKGQIPCLLRDRFDLINGKDNKAYSNFEKNNEKFINTIKKHNHNFIKMKESGLNIPYCFKSEYNNAIDNDYKNNFINENSITDENIKEVIFKFKSNSNQVFTRSLHAEENAFLQISKDGGVGIHNGILFTTASPCELCSKKAYQLGIKKIYYIDPYPGIAISNILKSGENRPILNLFHGALGRAFHNFYTPRMAYKDEITARSKDSNE